MCDVSDPALREAYDDVLKDSSETNWCLIGYTDNKTLGLSEKGSGGFSELKDKFLEDACQFAYLRVVSGDEESKRSKFVLISWCGEKVGALKRAKMSVHKASVKSVFKNFSVEYHAEHLEELDEENIMKMVKKAGGADYSGTLH